MVDKKKMTVAEMLAAARNADSKKSQEAAPSAAPSEPAASASEPTPPAPAAKSAPAAKPAASGGARPSVAEMMAAARAQKGTGGAPAAKEAPKPVEAQSATAAAPKKASPKPAAKEPIAKAPAEPKETASILAASQKEHKPGPMSKAEAAAKPATAPSPAAVKSAAAKQGRPVPPMPVKPDYAKPKPAKPVDDDRRSVLMLMLGSFLGIGFTSMATTFGLWTLGTARFMFPNILTEPPSKFKVGFPSNFAPGQVETKFIAQYGVWVVNWEYNGQREIYALRTVCTHLGCTPNWLEGEQKFKCPCHGSGFYKDGINFEGPAPRPLERYAIHLADDGQLEIDKSKLFQEELGQWSNPDSFVPV
jgi:cytochrome b6-f complex iron-sulfur subunit